MGLIGTNEWAGLKQASSDISNAQGPVYKQDTVLTELERLAEEINRLHSAMAALSTKLSPVLKPVPVQDGDQAKSATSDSNGAVQSSLGLALISYREEIRRLVGQVQAIVQALEF